MDKTTNGLTVSDTIGSVLKSHLPEPEWQWLSSQVESIKANPDASAVARIFTSLPRHLRSGNTSTVSTLEKVSGPDDTFPLRIDGWPVSRLARVWVLMGIPAIAEADYVQLIERLFKYGDMEELTALYSALPVYHYPEAWVPRCKEGVRSNIGPVRHAVMADNPYPASFLEEEAWNQLVLKAFFTEEDIPSIFGLKRRNNRELAEALTDYAYERYAAKREINPMLWVLVGPFTDGRAFDLMKRIMDEDGPSLGKQAIAYAFKQSGYAPAGEYLRVHGVSASLMESGGTPWEGWDKETEDTNRYNEK